ncbi:MAG: prepilin-type N-terminal cleavage/methylation domain-containing protein [Planctomycetota bacterium]
MQSTPNNAGFTLVEVLVVTTIMAVLAATALPAISSMGEAQRAAAPREVKRMLVVARSSAVVTGLPAGVELSIANDTAQLVRIDGAAVVPADASSGSEALVVSLADTFNGAGLQSVSGGVSSAAGEQIWFRFDGSPEVRGANGELIGALATDAIVTFDDAATVTVVAGSGLVE